MKAIGYVRVSTEKQASDGVSLAAQEERIRAYANECGFELVAILRDEAVSGGMPLAERPAGGELVRLLAKGAASVVIGWSLSRMFRSTPDALEQTKLWDKRGVALHLVCEGGKAVDCSSADGRFRLTVEAALDERERLKIGERTRFALAHLKQNGFAYGQTPFGFVREGDRLLPCPEEQHALAWIRSLRASGRSLRAIAAAMNAAGIPTKQGGARWYACSIRCLLANAVTTTTTQGVAA